MKKLIFLLPLLGVFVSSCVTLSPSVFIPKPKNEVLLPTLDTQFDMSSFNAYYPDIITGGNTMRATCDSVNFSISYDSKPIQIMSNFYAQDIINNFERDVKDNITNPYGDRKGSIVCKLMYSKRDNADWYFTILSGVTFLTANILGMPLRSQRAIMDIEVEIYDLSGKLIGRYSAHGDDKERVALYYGYNTEDAARKANIMAFQQAMQHIKIQINNEADRLNNILNNQ